MNENSASDPYIKENTIDHGENGHNVGINDAIIIIDVSDSSNIKSTNINSNNTTTIPLVQLNLFGEVSVDQGEKKWVKEYKKKNGTIVKQNISEKYRTGPPLSG